MNVTLVYPPNRNIPSSPYGALPLLAGCLGDAGHRVRIVDANLDTFERLIQNDTLEAAHREFEAMWTRLRNEPALTAGELRHLQGLAELSVVPFERLKGGEEAGRILRDPELFADPEKVNWAYDTLANVTRALYAINPLFYLLKPGALDEFFGYMESDFTNPVKQLVDAHAIDAILATEPELVGVCVPFNEQFVEAFSLLKELKRRAPHIKTIVGGAIITAYAEKLCRDERFYQYADYGMPGEADQAFPEFVTALEQGGDLDQIPNLFR
ncbi:MAG: cobalamin B12-binding domain-containing protein, partial [Planctomycetota bacterium]